MIYRAIGIMSGSSLDGLDIAFAEFTATGGKWDYQIIAADCVEYSDEWQQKLVAATTLTALDYQLLHTEYGHFIGKLINQFIEQHGIQHQVNLVASHGHTTFHLPAKKMTAQLGDGASIAAETQLPVISDLRALDVALDGQGAPIVPIGEKLLFTGYNYFLNLGGIANISVNSDVGYTAFDVCAANRVLNLLANEAGEKFDEGGYLAAEGTINDQLLKKLNELEFYQQAAPKSLANSFGTEIVFPIIKNAAINTADALRTYVEHICIQVKNAAGCHQNKFISNPQKMLVTGGGALNHFLIERLLKLLGELSVEIIVPDEKTIQYKEAVIMALIGILRWREEVNVLASVTGASKASIGGALWLG